MPVLQYLDILIGYSFAMLLLATVAGALVEAAQAMFRSQTWALENGLARLIVSLGLDEKQAAALAKQVTSDSPVKGSVFSADGVQREEFVLILLRKAAADPTVRDAIKGLLNGKTPEALLQDIEKNLLKAEADEPNAPSYLWRVKAMQAAGADALAGRVFSWYDNMTRRVDDSVNFQGRAIGLVAAAAVCFYLLPVDSIDLLSRLGKDEVFRKALVERAIEEAKKDPGKTEQVVQDVSKLADETRGILKPAAKPTWEGLALTWLMVSLGSAFWWGTLKKLVGLKSSLTEKLDAQRLLRETAQPATRPSA